MPRKKPYSGKKKKLQLQEKRRRKLTNENKSDESENEEEGTKGSKSDTEEDHGEKLTVEEQPEKLTKTFNPNRFRLQFLQESNAELRRGREKGRQPLSPVPEIELEVNDDEVKDYIDIAKRPPWDYRMTTEQLESRESKYFQEYLNKIFSEHDLNELSYFELNLETWRQLWRVLEKSDILLMIVDIRYPMLHFSPALYNHIVHDIGKKAILILNKIDMVPPELVIAWKEYFLLKYPKLRVACFTSYPKEAITNQSPGKAKMKRRRGGRMTTNMGAQELLEICEDIVQNNVDLSSWRHKIESESEAADLADETFEEEDNEGETTHKQSTSVKYKNGILTIGCLGYPNVGKSSLLNGLKGVKVVSVSKTPGHTKHFQTIFLTPTVKLCDCPGLVFPSKVDKALQVLAGIYPISQVREPFSAIRYLAERTDVISILHLHHPDNESKEWSPYDLCEALAIKKGLLTAKAGRPDIHRSANLILRMGLDGRLCLALRPPGFTKNRDIWLQHQDTKLLIEKLSKYKTLAEESSESSVDEFDDEKDENDNETSDEDVGMKTDNPFAVLAND